MKLSDAEWLVMGALWEGAPATARTVRERVPEAGWAHTTVKTLLARLVAKGAVAEDKDGRATRYRPLVSRPAARREAVRGLVERAFDGAFGSLFQHLVRDERLSARDRDRLRTLLAELDDSGEPHS